MPNYSVECTRMSFLAITDQSVPPRTGILLTPPWILLTEIPGTRIAGIDQVDVGPFGLYLISMACGVTILDNIVAIRDRSRVVNATGFTWETGLGDTERLSAAPQQGLLGLLAQADTDPTGIKTFERYVWQAKQALRQWLTCLSEHDGPFFVVCEQVEDIALVYRDRVRFLQLKTRDRGSWSALAMCARGIDALVRSYISARKVGLHERASFELWLEGPISDVPATVEFAARPPSADKTMRTKIISHGLKRAWLEDFLQRLVVHPDQPTRAHIDAKVVWELGAIWPMLPQPELEHIYERLLIAVAAAQAAATTPATVQAHLVAAQPYIQRELPEPDEPGATAIDLIRNQVLSHAMLAGLTPPRPGESVEQLLSRMSEGSAASLLELKMRAAGAAPQTIRQAQELRADMEVQRQLLLASRDTAEADLEQLSTRLLLMADATASRIMLTAANSPAAAARPAEAVAADLLSRPADVGQCDRGSVFGGDGHLIYGYLCHLSDECRFPWRAA
jgi:hypothetical protein